MMNHQDPTACMAKVPILCHSCERLSVTESILGGDAPFAMFETVGFGPCPHCGGDCEVLDGSYSFIEDTITFLRGPDRTVTELKRLAAILQNARSRGETFQSVAAEIKRELPKLASFMEILPRNRAEFYAFASLVIAAIGLLFDAGHSGDSRTITVNQVINAIHVEQTIGDNPREPTHSPHLQSVKTLKLGRNDVCHCGSGKKFKKCHGI